MPALHNPLAVWLHNPLAVCLGLAFLTARGVQAAPPPHPPVPAAVPDYGGRDSAMPTAVGEAAPDPASSVGRALEALVVVLAGVAGTVYVLKRFNLVKPGAGGAPARLTGPLFGRAAGAADPAVTVVSSQALPGGGMLHVVRVGERTLLLGATAQSVTAITEWDTLSAEAPTLSDEFEDYLTRADPLTGVDSHPAASGIAAANARLRSLLSPQQPEEPS